jgi:hypothetical protein
MKLPLKRRLRPTKEGHPVRPLKEFQPMLTEHQYARIYRRVRAATMVDPRSVAEYDAVRNIVFINAERFDELPSHEQAEVYRPSTFV